jgi:hypothetical protein
MWDAFSLHEHMAAGCGNLDGWFLMLHRMPGSRERHVFLTIHAPEGAQFKLDKARPPYLYAGNIEIDIGNALSLHLTMSEFGLNKPQYEAFDDRVSGVVWHGKPSDGIGVTLPALAKANLIQADVFVHPREIIFIEFDTEGFSKAVSRAFGIPL